MEEKKKSYPSLPSNYVTLAQLQERWLKQQNQINQPQQPQEDQPKQQQQQVAVVVAPTKNVTVSRSRPSDRKNRNDSATNRRATDVAGIGDETTDLDGKVGESKKKIKKWKRKRKVKERKASGEGTEAAQGNEGAEKTTIESELNDKKNCNTTTVVEEVEKKLGVLSMNTGNGKQNGGSRRMNDDSHRSQSQRNHRGGYSYGKFRGQQQQRYEVKMQRRKNMVWVKKDGSVGETES